MRRCANISKISKKRMQVLPVTYMTSSRRNRRAELTFTNSYNLGMA